MALPCNNMNLNLYRVFYTVAKTKSFSESSRTLHISQPAISKHIQNLEYELNTLLFYRTNRGIELTDEQVESLKNTAIKNDDGTEETTSNYIFQINP